MLQKSAVFVCLTVIFIVGILLYRAHANSGVSCYNSAHVSDTYARACNDVRVNVRTPTGFYTGYGNCKAWIDDESAEDRGPIWARVYHSGRDRYYSVRERSVKIYGTAQVTSGAIASGSF